MHNVRTGNGFQRIMGEESFVGNRRFIPFEDIDDSVIMNQQQARALAFKRQPDHDAHNRILSDRAARRRFKKQLEKKGMPR